MRTAEMNFGTFSATETGGYLVERFRAEDPDAKITEVKTVDLILWQTPASNRADRMVRQHGVQLCVVMGGRDDRQL